MTELLRIGGAEFRQKLEGRRLSQIDATEKPRLHWIAIANLRVDPSYQRKIHGRSSERNIIEIAVEFDWAKFAPVVVAEVGEGIFAIIDGQHRTTAAALRGIRDVPCLVHRADVPSQASAFAAINGRVTPISTMQLFHARVAAGDAAAIELRDVCASAGVTICRYPVAGKEMKVGQTLAPSKLAQQLARYRQDTLHSALCCITRTQDGNIGWVRPPLVEALCAVIEGEPAWSSDLDQLLQAMQTFDFPASYSKAQLAALRDRVGISVSLVEIISEHLEAQFADIAD